MAGRRRDRWHPEIFALLPQSGGVRVSSCCERQIISRGAPIADNQFSIGLISFGQRAAEQRNDAPGPPEARPVVRGFGSFRGFGSSWLWQLCVVSRILEGSRESFRRGGFFFLEGLLAPLPGVTLLLWCFTNAAGRGMKGATYASSEPRAWAIRPVVRHIFHN